MHLDVCLGCMGCAGRCGHLSACTSACANVHARVWCRGDFSHHPLKRCPLVLWHHQGRVFLTALECGLAEMIRNLGAAGFPKSCGIHSFVSAGKISPPTGVPDCLCPLVPWSQPLPCSSERGLPTNHSKALPLFALPKAWAGAQSGEQESDRTTPVLQAAGHAMFAVLAVCVSCVLALCVVC